MEKPIRDMNYHEMVEEMKRINSSIGTLRKYNQDGTYDPDWAYKYSKKRALLDRYNAIWKIIECIEDNS